MKAIADLLDWSTPICGLSTRNPKEPKLLKILPDSDKGHVIPEWLLGTRDWTLGGRKRHDQQIGDLFTVFVAQMEELVEQGHIERNATYERAIEFVQELRNRRDTLDVST